MASDREWDERPYICDPSGWEEYLTEFDDKVFPIFASHGFSKNSAIVVFQTNQLYNKMAEILDALEEDDDG